MRTMRALDHLVRRVFEAEMRAWRGNEPLERVFWGYGVLGSGILIAVYFLAVDQNRIAVAQAFLLLFLGYTIWLLVALWRCSAAAELFWQMLVRSLIFVWGGNTLLVVLFLQADLLERYFLG